jgi:hypothetical protein
MLQRIHKIPAKAELEKLLDGYPWISQRNWAQFFDVSASTFNGWVNKNTGVAEDKLRVIRLLNHVETAKRQAVTKLLNNSGIRDFIRFISSLEHLALKSDWIKFFGNSFTSALGEMITPGSLISDLLQRNTLKRPSKEANE